MTKSGAHRWWALGALTLAIMASALNATVLNVALPTLAGALKASETDLQWFITAYNLAAVIGLLPAGLLGDRYGRKAVMILSLVLFAAGSIGCAWATGPGMFIVARAVQGLAGAGIIVIAASFLPILFDEAERPRAVGIWAAANFLAMPLGPILGGWILSNAWWGWVFLMNLPIVLIALIAVVALVPESRAAKRPAVDFVGVLLSSVGLGALMYAVVQAGTDGPGSSSAIVPAAVGLLVLVAFVLWENRLMTRPGGEPLVDLSVFRDSRFTWGVILTALGVFGLFGVMFALPQYVTAVMGLDAQGSGFRLLPLIAGVIVGALPADRIAARLGAKITVTAGFTLMVAGLAVGTTMAATSGDAFIAAWTFFAGIGSGMAFSTTATTAIVELSPEHSGIGSAVLQVFVKLGPAFGGSILGSVLNSTYQAQVNLAGLPAQAAEAVKSSVFAGIAVAGQLHSSALLASVQTAFVAGMDDAVRFAAGIGVVAVVLTILFLPGRQAAKAIRISWKEQTGDLVLEPVHAEAMDRD